MCGSSSIECPSETTLVAIPEITVEELMDRYAVLLLDAYGVLMHSSGALPGAVELIAELERRGKPFYVLTNDAYDYITETPEFKACAVRIDRLPESASAPS